MVNSLVGWGLPHFMLRMNLEGQVMDIFRRKSGILVAIWRFLGKIREELNNEYRLLNIEYRGKKWGNNKTANKFISELVQ